MLAHSRSLFYPITSVPSSSFLLPCFIILASSFFFFFSTLLYFSFSFALPSLLLFIFSSFCLACFLPLYRCLSCCPALSLLLYVSQSFPFLLSVASFFILSFFLFSFYSFFVFSHLSGFKDHPKLHLRMQNVLRTTTSVSASSPPRVRACSAAAPSTTNPTRVTNLRR